MEAKCKNKDISPGLLSRPDVAEIDSVKLTLENKSLFDLFEKLYGEEAGVVSYKWLRAVSHNKFTGLHVDRVYMGSHSERMITAWALYFIFILFKFSIVFFISPIWDILLWYPS